MVNNWNATSTVDVIAMSLLRYLKRAGGLPDPRGPLSSTLPGNVIAAANREVEKELKTKKRGQYKKYTPLAGTLLNMEQLLQQGIFPGFMSMKSARAQ